MINERAEWGSFFLVHDAMREPKPRRRRRDRTGALIGASIDPCNWRARRESCERGPGRAQWGALVQFRSSLMMFIWTVSRRLIAADCALAGFPCHEPSSAARDMTGWPSSWPSRSIVGAAVVFVQNCQIFKSLNI